MIGDTGFTNMRIGAVSSWIFYGEASLFSLVPNRFWNSNPIPELLQRPQSQKVSV